MNAPAHQFGPATSWAEITPAVAAVLPAYEADADHLVWYDGPIVSLSKEPVDGSFILRVVADANLSPHEIRQTETVHFLSFPTREDALATLHDDVIPTRETYQRATRIVRLISSWNIDKPGAFSDHRISFADESFDTLPADEIPDRHLVSGGMRMIFEAASYEAIKSQVDPLYAWRNPIDHTLMTVDGPRVWIETNPRPFSDNERVFLLVNVEDDGPREVHYRLGFRSEDELRATLHRGYAPTEVSYLTASSIMRETLTTTSNPEKWTLLVEGTTLDKIPAAHRPGKDIQPSPAD